MTDTRFMKTIKYFVTFCILALSTQCWGIWNSSSFNKENYSFVFRFETQMLCTATLLSAKVAITAAHCFSDFDYFSARKIRVTTYSNEDIGFVRFKKIMFHPQFNTNNLEDGTIPAGDAAFDTALIILTDNSQSLNNSTKSITEKWGALNIADFSISQTDNIIGLGLGNTNDNDQLADLGAINLKSNSTIHSALNSNSPILNFTPKTNQSMCPGDSGGPIIKITKTGPILLGNLSGKVNTRTGSDTKNAKPCEDQNHLFYVSNFFLNRHWITTAINEN